MADPLMDMSIATTVVIISFIISGISLGVGRAFGYKRLESFGAEELAQSIINAALIGAITAIILSANEISTSLLYQTCGNATNAIDTSLCFIENLTNTSSESLNLMVESTNLIGYYQSLNLNLGSVSIQPFVNLKGPGDALNSQIQSLQTSLLLLNLNAAILTFFGTSALQVFLPLGLILRSFFATRKVGGFLIALSLGLYLFYPLLLLIFPVPSLELSDSVNEMSLFLNNSIYATYPIVDLNSNTAIAEKLDNMSEGNFTSDITVILQENSFSLSKIFFYSIFAPIFALIITIVFIKGLADILGTEFTLTYEVI